MMPFLHRKCAVVCCLIFASFFNLPNIQAQSLDDYQTNGNVTFASATNWQRYDGSGWVAATSAPTSANGQITIRNSHTASVTTNVTLDQVVIQNGGILKVNTTGVAWTINDSHNPIEDLEIQSGGTYIHGSGNPSINGSVPGGNGNIRVRNNGILKVENAGGGGAHWYANNESSNTIKDRMNWETGAIFEWNTNLAFSTNGLTYFPNVTTEVPIFRISANVSVGAGAPTVINGVLEAVGGQTNPQIIWANAGLKTFRNGIRGAAKVIQATSSGEFLITGPSAELSGSGELELSNDGLRVTATTLDCSAAKTVTASSHRIVYLEGGTDQQIQQIGGSGTLTFSTNISLAVNKPVGLAGNVTANGIVQLSGGSITLNNSNLTVNTLSGFNDSRYIITNSDKNATSGFLIQNATGGKVFPVGSKAGDYTPAFVTSSVPYKVRVFDKVYLNGNGNTEVDLREVVNKTWHILPESGNANATMQLQWNVNNEGTLFQETRIATPEYIIIAAAPAGGPWANVDAVNLSGSNPFTLSTDGEVNSSTYTYFTAYDNPFVPLPVKLLSFNGRREGTGIRLEWRTVSEKDNAGFEVQRSADLKEFVKIGFVEANEAVQNIHHYAFTDENQQRDGYYRLKQLDHNGKFQYSKAIYVQGNISSTVEGLLLYPNPTTGSVHLSIPNGPVASLSLHSAQGALVTQMEAGPNDAEAQLNEKLRNLPAGIYFLQTIQGTQVYRNKIIKH